MKESERCSRLLLLLQDLINNNDIASVELLGTMVKKDTPAMQKSYDIMTENFLKQYNYESFI